MRITKTVNVPDELSVGSWDDMLCNDRTSPGIPIYQGDSPSLHPVAILNATHFSYPVRGVDSDTALLREHIRNKMFAFAERLVNAYNTLNSDGERKDG